MDCFDPATGNILNKEMIAADDISSSHL